MIDQIIKLKRQYNLVEEDATPEKEREWYSWALKNGHIVYVLDDKGELLGFLEWVRLNYVPAHLRGIQIDYSNQGPVLFVGNTIATKPGVLNTLKNITLEINADAKLLVWHNKDKNTFKVFSKEREGSDANAFTLQ